MNFLKIKRRNSLKIKVGNVEIGGDAPISVQSMTNTKTEDVQATLDQVKQLEDAGADLVRISVPNEEAATAFKFIKKDSIVTAARQRPLLRQRIKHIFLHQLA